MSTGISQETEEDLVNKLQSQIANLKTKNKQLRNQLNEARRAVHPTESTLGAIRYRSQQHRRAKESLILASRWVRSAQVITIIFGIILASYVAPPAIYRSQISSDKLKSELHRSFPWVVDGRVTGVIASILGFAVSISGQLIFPAPWRSFVTAFIFALKQIFDIFLPEWCVAFLPLFGFIALFTLDQDRKKQVSVEIK